MLSKKVVWNRYMYNHCLSENNSNKILTITCRVHAKDFIQITNGKPFGILATNYCNQYTYAQVVVFCHSYFWFSPKFEFVIVVYKGQNVFNNCSARAHTLLSNYYAFIILS